MNTSTIIRNAKPEDAKDIAVIHPGNLHTKGIISEDYLSRLDVESRTLQRTKALQENKSITLVAETSRIVGFANAGKSRLPEYSGGELYAIYILEKFQGKGIGNRLFSEIVKRLKDQGFNSMFVWVLKENPWKQFYKRMGGRFLDQKEIRIGDQVFTEEAYDWKDLSAFL